MFVYLASFIFSAAVSAVPYDSEDIHPTIEIARSGEKIKFRAFDQDRLEPDGDVIADDFTVMNGMRNNFEHLVNVENKKRKLFKNRRMGSTLFIDDNREGSAIMNGLVNSQTKIEPYEPKKLSKDGRIAHLVSKLSKYEKSYVTDKIVNPFRKEDLNETARQLTENYCIKIFFILDSHFAKKFKSENDLKVYFRSMMTKVQLMFNSLALGITVRWIGFITLKNETEKNFTFLNGDQHLDMFELLDEIAQYFCDNNKYELADVIFFISGGRLFSNSRGAEVISYAGGICNRCEKHGIIIDNSTILLDHCVFISHGIATLISAFGSPDSFENTNSPGSKYCSSCKSAIIPPKSIQESPKFSCCARENIKYFLRLERARCIVGECIFKRSM